MDITLIQKPEIWIITVYEPDADEWVDFSIRKR